MTDLGKQGGKEGMKNPILLRLLHWWLWIRHIFKHRWIYGGRKFYWSDGSWSIQGTRYCWLCEKREYFYFGIGSRKSGWYSDKFGLETCPIYGKQEGGKKDA